MGSLFGAETQLEAKKLEADRFAKNVAPIIRDIKKSGVTSLRGIARSLEDRKVPTARGGRWEAVQVATIIERVAA